VQTRAPLLALIVAIGISGCGSDTGRSGSDRLAVVATTTQIGDFARNVAGDRATVTQLLPANADPHEYEPTPDDVAAVADADLVLENGVGLDDWLDDVIRNAGGDASRVTTSTGITLRPGDEESPAGDPHLWFDPRNATAMVRNIETALANADPEGRATYRGNADAYVADIDALDAELRRRIAVVPQAKRKIVTDHDAIGYFAARYGITIVGTVLPSLSTAAEPSAKELAALATTIRREGVRVVFSEASIDQRLQATLAAEADVRLGDPLYSDALGPADTPAGTYLGMMRSNMDAIIAGIST
jgi:ABC-type Zn uptake system ZnuABC Zn-binding protein ZnuA